MRKFIALAMFAVSLSALAPQQAKADTFVWKDVVHDYTISFPDVWRIQTPDDAYTRLRIAGPLGEDHATCRMQVHHDGRALIYPKRLVDEAVREKLDRNFWETRVAEYNDARIIDFYDPASLGGKGDATAVQIAFEQDTGEGMSKMRGFMIGSLYGPNRYEITCAAKSEVYERWANLFLSIIDSVELESKYHPFPTGYYRGFLRDPKLVLPTFKPGTRDEKAGQPYFAGRSAYHH